MKSVIREGSNTGSSAPGVRFTPTGRSAEGERVALAPLDFKEAMKGLLNTSPKGKNEPKSR